MVVHDQDFCYGVREKAGVWIGAACEPLVLKALWSLCDISAFAIKCCALPHGALTTAATGDTMLILTRKVGEAIRIGDDIQVIITAVDQNKVKVGIHSPRHVPIFREELYQRILEENRRAASLQADDLEALLDSISPKTP